MDVYALNHPPRPCAAVISTPTHRTFCICFASGTGAETRLIRGGSLILVAWRVGRVQLANASPNDPLWDLRPGPAAGHPRSYDSSTALPEAASSFAWSVFIRSRSASPRRAGE